MELNRSNDVGDGDDLSSLQSDNRAVISNISNNNLFRHPSDNNASISMMSSDWIPTTPELRAAAGSQSQQGTAMQMTLMDPIDVLQGTVEQRQMDSLIPVWLDASAAERKDNFIYTMNLREDDPSMQPDARGDHPVR